MITEVIYFLNELDLLEAHLEHHRPWNWRTVIVESQVTISGVQKPLFYRENRARFERFDVEHTELPVDLFPTIQGETGGQYAQFRKNDWAKRLWMQEHFDVKNPWIFHSDVDEIILNKVEPKDLENITYLAFNLDQYMAQVNRRVRKQQHAYRLARADLSIKKLQAVKQNKRATVNGGWHFTNCPSTAEEMRLKAQCRPWYFGAEHPSHVPGVETFQGMMGKALNFISGQPLGKNRIVGAEDLPQWMQKNIELFPLAVM